MTLLIFSCIIMRKFIFLFCVLLVSSFLFSGCYAFLQADKLIYAGTVGKKKSSVTIDTTFVISSQAPE